MLGQVAQATAFNLLAGASMAAVFPLGGGSGTTTRGPWWTIHVDGHTEPMRIRLEVGETAVGPWLVVHQDAVVASVPRLIERRLPAANFVRVELRNTGVGATTGTLTFQELPDYHPR